MVEAFRGGLGSQQPSGQNYGRLDIHSIFEKKLLLLVQKNILTLYLYFYIFPEISLGSHPWFKLLNLYVV